MQLFKRSSLLLLYIFCMYDSNAQPQPKEFHLRNAYEISGWLYKVKRNTFKPSKEEKEKMLGSLIWYANLQDKEYASSDLNTRLSHYNELSLISKKIIQDLASVDTFFKMTINANSPYVNEITDVEVKNKFVAFNKIYRDNFDELDKLQKEYEEFEKKYLIAKSSLITQITTYTNDIEKLKADSVSISQQLIEANDNETNSLLQKLKLMNDSLDSKRKSLNTFKIELINQTEKQARLDLGLKLKKENVEVIKNQIEKYFEINIDKLSSYFIKINNTDISFEGVVSAKAYSDAFYRLTHDADYNFQSNLYLAEAQKYQGFRLPSQTDAIEAVAIYLANRIKQESVLWFFETITRNAETYDLVKIFFPTTIKLLQGNESYEVPNLGAQWRYSLSKDFMQMPRNILSSDWLKDTWPELNKYKTYLVGANDLADLIFKRYTYKDMIRSLYLSHNAASDAENENASVFSFHDLIRFLYAINTELFVPDTAAKFRPLTYEDFKNMPLPELEIMISLIDLKYNGIFSKILKGIGPQFKLNIANAEFLRQFLGNIETMIAQIEASGAQFLAEQKRIQQGGVQNDVFFTTYTIWETFNELLKVITKDDTNQYLNEGIKSAKQIFGHLQQIFEVYHLLSKKNFSGAVLSTISLVEKMIYDTDANQLYSINLFDSTNKFYSSDLLEKFRKIINHLEQAKVKMDTPLIKSIIQTRDSFSKEWNFTYNSLTQSISLKQKSLAAAFLFEKDRHGLQLIRKLSAFLNDVAMAKDDKQLAKVVESYAMPVGSYKRKRNNWASLDINAFAGGYIGFENARPQFNDQISNANSKRVKEGWVWGVSVPIGISYSTVLREKMAANLFSDELIQNPDRIRFSKDGKRAQFRTKSTLTFTASIIDLGAIVSYRLFNSGDKPLGQDLKWTQFISPGFHFNWAIKSTPLVWSWGIQYTPQLRKFEEGGVPNDKQYNATRIYTGIFFDLPLFNLWERKHIRSY